MTTICSAALTKSKLGFSPSKRVGNGDSDVSSRLLLSKEDRKICSRWRHGLMVEHVGHMASVISRVIDNMKQNVFT